MTPSTPSNAIDLSVVIPSYNRRESLVVLLEALKRQTLSPDRFEIIIVLDGCTDDSAAFLNRWIQTHPSFALNIFSQANAGQSAARSRGAAEARAPILLFLDDDIVPDPACLEAHMHCHQRDNTPTVVLGTAWMTRAANESYYALLTRMWWEDMYVERARRHPYSTYRDFCAGHVSMPHDLFRDMNGFDPDFQGYGGEDYDLGYRLLRAGVTFQLEPNAKAAHDHHGNAQQVFRNLIDEGRNDVRLGTKHPELRRGLRCAKPNLITSLFFHIPFLFHLGLCCFSIVLQVCERLHLWHAWRWLMGKLRFVAYWLGVSKAFPNHKAYRQWIDASPDRPRIVLDITDGLPADLSSVWLHGPSTITLHAGGREAGELDLDAIPQGPLAEYIADMIVKKHPDNPNV